MNWDQYKNKVIESALVQSLKEDYINPFLKYAEPLFKQNLPVILTALNFTKLVGMDFEYVCKMAHSQSKFYRCFQIKKKNGDLREISEPLPDLKYVQRWILSNILLKKPISDFAKAYAPGKNIKENARFHKGQKILVSLDIKDFFPSIDFFDVYSIFLNLGYNSKVSAFLSNLCCLNHVLPQGAPTSPYISNIRMLRLDENISDYCISRKWRYTRYADDLTFSGDGNYKELIRFVSDTVYHEGLQINTSKTRIARSNSRQVVTGIIVNEYMQVPIEFRKQIRQQMYYINKFGIESHLDYINETRGNYLLHLLGKVSFGIYINPKDLELHSYAETLRNLLSEDKHEP